MKLPCVLSFGLLLLSVRVLAQQAMSDGPYVFYHGSKGTVKSIGVVNGEPVVTANNFVKDSKMAQVLNVPVSGHPEWAFSVALKKKIAPRAATCSGADKMLFMSDIEGEFEAFRSLLLANKVMDEQYNWIYGKGQLILAGDLFDRGREVVPFLWLMYKLEDDARSKGGDVHVLLGNHDIMNLQGDFRYVQPEYKENARLLGEGYSALYAADTELGRWLRSKNIIEKIGDCLVMHGGLSPGALQKRFSVEQINWRCRPFYATPADELPDNLIDFLGENGLFWYRGYFMEPKASMATIDSTLTTYSAKLIVVGHTIVPRNIALYYGGKVLGLDVNEHIGHREAALYEKGIWYAVDDQGNKQKLIYGPANDKIQKQDVD